ncbi:ATP-dependent dethiobiotin synthetase BioD [Hyphomicrobium methylovorum]|uniref:dethiobiotin synthase n=1 Tax=Hyphomicrobium methylovorum TaxID=84 RepID=UPI0015E75F73|nr:dethiobiotin synthase [Hyphomicrobium methylovorum]MBA2126036.1 ATP-dependent dethiobiotin synthetase BioD [Hyphomicrobium methylovorum]
MSVRIVVAGTDTNIGKTVFAAALTQALGASYWKPTQSGLAGETDSEVVARLSKAGPERILPEGYRLNSPASPHVSAEIDGLQIDPDTLRPHDHPAPLVIELAGGLAVPLTRDLLQIDLLSTWALPVVLCASTRLGTINHSLLSIEALKRRSIPIMGIAFIGDEARDSEQTIAAFGGVKHLGRLPQIDPLDAHSLRAAFNANFNVSDFASEGVPRS